MQCQVFECGASQGMSMGGVGDVFGKVVFFCSRKICLVFVTVFGKGFCCRISLMVRVSVDWVGCSGRGDAFDFVSVVVFCFCIIPESDRYGSRKRRSQFCLL